MKKRCFFGLIFLFCIHALVPQDGRPSSPEPSHSKITAPFILLKNGFLHYLGVLPWEMPVSTKDTNPFTYNLNPVGKYFKLFILIHLEKNALYNIHKLSASAKTEQANWEKIEEECDNFLAHSIIEAEITRKNIIADIPQHFEQLFDPVSGILN